VKRLHCYRIWQVVGVVVDFGSKLGRLNVIISYVDWSTCCLVVKVT